MNIYVGNLAYGVTEDELRDAFSAYGEISSVNLISDKFSGESKGFGFVEMPNNSEADAAIKALNETPLKGRNMKVNQAKPRSDRPPARRPPGATVDRRILPVAPPRSARGRRSPSARTGAAPAYRPRSRAPRRRT